MPPMSAPDDLVLNLPTVFSTLTRLQRGLCPVSSLGESHSLYYEIHGSPSADAAHPGDVSPKKMKNKMVFIMGLSSSCFSWGPQMRWFGAGVPRAVGDGEEEEYTVLVFDNRGVGNSGCPRGPYT